MPFWDREIDMMILTHPDADHTGQIEVMRRFGIGKILYTEFRIPRPSMSCGRNRHRRKTFFASDGDVLNLRWCVSDVLLRVIMGLLG